MKTQHKIWFGPCKYKFPCVWLFLGVSVNMFSSLILKKQKMRPSRESDLWIATLQSECQGYGFSSGQVWMWELDCEESWAPKNWCFWSVVLEKTLESPLDCKEIQPVLSEGDQPWDFFGRNGAKAETPGLWPPHVKSWLIGKGSESGRDWAQ